MTEVSSGIPRRVNRHALVHSARTAIAAVVSLLVARVLGVDARPREGQVSLSRTRRENTS